MNFGALIRVASFQLLMAAASSVLAEAPASAADPAAALRASCEALQFADFSQIADAPTRIAEAEFLGVSADAPAACLLRGYVAPQVGFELKLPATGWNGRFIEVGSGGYAGTTRSLGEQSWCSEAVRRGYACLYSDHGHTAGTGSSARAALDGIWSYHNLQAEVDFGFRALHVAALAGKAIAAHHFGRAPEKSYFVGCSGGGRQALVAAQRFPWDFDGILAMEPALNWTRTFMTFLYNLRTATDAEGKALFAPSDLDRLHAAAVAACDLDDGVKDGVIGHPPSCRFDPAQLACGDRRQEGCLSPAQIDAANRLYAGPVNTRGEKLAPGGVMRGAERGVFGFGIAKPVAAAAVAEFFRYMAFMPDAGPGWKPADFDFDADHKRLGLMEAIYASTNPDLREFRAAGGKLIIVQGWDDGGTPFPLGTIDYYETVERTMGGRKATQEFARLFMVPGRDHCAGGDGAGAADYFGALETWVEADQAPDMIRAAHLESVKSPAEFSLGPADASRVEFTRPLYPYPARAKYKGSGDPNDYRSFKRVEPR